MKFEYKIVPTTEVQTFLDEGWNLYGSPVPIASLLWQALTKLSNNDKEKK